MRTSKTDVDGVIRMNIHVVRAEHPALYDELKKIGKGIKRTARLKTLASERLLLSGRSVPFPDGAPAPSPRAALTFASAERHPIGEDEVVAAQELFLPPIK